MNVAATPRSAIHPGLAAPTGQQAARHLQQFLDRSRAASDMLDQIVGPHGMADAAQRSKGYLQKQVHMGLRELVHAASTPVPDSMRASIDGARMSVDAALGLLAGTPTVTDAAGSYIASSHAITSVCALLDTSRAQAADALAALASIA